MQCLFFLAINRKRLCQALSSVDNSVIFLLFGCLILLGLTEKSTNYMRGLYVYVIMITPRAITDFYNLSSHKKFTIFVNYKFSKKLRYSGIFQAAAFRLHPPFSTRGVTRLHFFWETLAASFTVHSGKQAFNHLQFSIAFYQESG